MNENEKLKLLIKLADRFFSKRRIFISSNILKENKNLSGYEFVVNNNLKGVLMFANSPFNGVEYSINDLLDYSNIIFGIEDKAIGKGKIDDGKFVYLKEHPTKKTLVVAGLAPAITNITL